MQTYIPKCFLAIKKLSSNRILRRKKQKCDAIIKKINIDDNIQDNRTSGIPHNPFSVLLLDTLDCFGDAIFINGIIHELNKRIPKTQIIVATNRKLASIYSTSRCKIIDINEPLPLADIVIDLCYSDNALIDFRIDKLKSVKSFIITCSRLLANAKIFSAHFDFRKTKHFGERTHQIASVVQKIVENKIQLSPSKNPINQFESSEILFPYIPRSSTKGSIDDYIYINTEGRTEDRNISPDQLNFLANHLSQHFPSLKAIVYSNNPDSIQVIKNHSQLSRAITKNFLDACQLVEHSILTITPDTSIVHVASAYNVPVVALYCGNDLEYFREFSTSEIWAPLSESHISIKPPVFWVSQVPINRIPPAKITEAVDSLLTQLLNPNS